MKDIFRPTRALPRALYDAFQKEADKREGKTVEEWIRNENMAVWKAARDYALAHELKPPTMQQVVDKSHYASGHIDYGAKWVYGVESIMGKEQA